jgi:hypothetical protein
MNNLSNALLEQQEQELMNAFQIEEMEERLETAPWSSCTSNQGCGMGPNY